MTNRKQRLDRLQSIPPIPLTKGGVNALNPVKTRLNDLTSSPFRGGLGNYLYLLQKSIPTKSSGFTIVECLLAIILVGILMTAISPVIVLSVATRVQARRVEQATQAARSYIDGVQSGTIPIPNNIVPLTEVTGTKFSSDRDSFATLVGAPINPLTCPIDPTAASYYCQNPPAIAPDPATQSLYCIDLDRKGCESGSSRNFVVQAFRSTNAAVPGVLGAIDDGSKGYILGVRVYRADAFDGTRTLSTTRVIQDAGNKKVATYAGGKGNQFSPLVEMTTEVGPKRDSGNPGNALKSLKERLGTVPTPSPSPT